MIRGSVTMLHHSFCLQCIFHFASSHHENLHIIGVEGDRELTVQGTRSLPIQSHRPKLLCFDLPAYAIYVLRKLYANQRKKRKRYASAHFSKRHKRSTVLPTDLAVGQCLT